MAESRPNPDVMSWQLLKRLLNKDLQARTMFPILCPHTHHSLKCDFSVLRWRQRLRWY